jgi:uncharacterized protein (TIGR02186 family)
MRPAPHGLTATGLVLCLCLLPQRPAAGQALVADLSEHLVAITTGFTGTDVLLFGATEGEGDVVVVVRGPPTDTVVRRQARVAGIWINEASVRFEGVPSYYALASSRPLEEIVPAALAARQQIGLAQLKLVPAEEASERKEAEFREALVRNKQRAGLFAHSVGRVEFLGNRLFRTNVYFPANVPTGSYMVEVLLLRDGDIAQAQTTPLIVSKIGIGADVYEFAHRQSAAYGGVAIFGALMAGWFAHLAFRRR